MFKIIVKFQSAKPFHRLYKKYIGAALEGQGGPEIFFFYIYNNLKFYIYQPSNKIRDHLFFIPIKLNFAP